MLETNIRPKLMSEAELKAGAAWLTNRIYSPDSFARRLRLFVEASPTRSGSLPPRPWPARKWRWPNAWRNTGPPNKTCCG